MVFKVGSTTVVNNSNQIDWSLISSKPTYVASLIKTNFGDLTVAAAPSCNAQFYAANSTLEIWFNSNCACACACDCASCFLNGSLVKMSNGDFKAIEEIKVGDLIQGAFGEINQVIGLDWVVLGNRFMYKINEEHSTSDDHPHIGVDRNFYSAEPDAIKKEWGNYFDVILADGKTARLKNRGLTDLSRIKQMAVGNVLQTLNGPKEISTFTQYTLPPETKLYNLVVGGSHTYFVNGYAVSGWPREDDFDYSNWKPIGKPLTIEHYR